MIINEYSKNFMKLLAVHYNLKFDFILRIYSIHFYESCLHYNVSFRLTLEDFHNLFF